MGLGLDKYPGQKHDISRLWAMVMNNLARLKYYSPKIDIAIIGHKS